MPNFLKRLSRSIRGFSHRQALTRLRDDLHFVPTVIYDIGAHQARWTTVARGIFPDSQYFLFEANPDNAEVLQASKERHFIATLSFADGIECDFFVPRANISTTGASLYRERSVHYQGNNARVVRVTTRRLDSLVAEERLPPPDLIKLDVQGAELAILRGSGALLDKCSAIIAEVSLLPGNDRAPLAAEVMMGFGDYGFRCVDLCKVRRTRIGSVTQLDLLFAKNALYGRYMAAADVLDPMSQT